MLKEALAMRRPSFRKVVIPPKSPGVLAERQKAVDTLIHPNAAGGAVGAEQLLARVKELSKRSSLIEALHAKYAAMPKAPTGPFMKRLRMAFQERAPKAAILGVGTGAVFGGAYVYNKARRAVDYNKDFRNMMEAHPSLHDEDQHLVKTRFNTLHTLAPTLSNDPLVAGSIVKQWIEYPVLTAATIKDVASVEKDLKQDPSLMKQLLSAVGSLGGGGG